MSDVEQILAAVPLDDVAQALGVDRATAEQATRAAIPTLLAGMQANASDDAGAASLAAALGQHDDALAQGASLDQIDTADGEAIVSNIFGPNKDAVISTLSSAPAAGPLGEGTLGKLLPKLLPILAPIVLSWLAKRVGGGQAPGSGDAQPSGGGGLADILGSILGSGGSSTGSSGGGGLGDILGSILGGAAGAPSGAGTPSSGSAAGGGQGGGDLGSILGDLLGGGKR